MALTQGDVTVLMDRAGVVENAVYPDIGPAGRVQRAGVGETAVEEQIAGRA
jgi:hypothetical protein